MEKEIFSPLVSIIIPVYNGSNYMREAIDSALAQTYKNIEIIVVNDGSKDNTDEIARSYGDKIRYFAKENGGVATALNLAIKEAKGDYISWLSHDDVYYYYKIQKQIELLAKLEDKNTILFSDINFIDENSKIFSNRIIKNMYSNPNEKLPLLWLLNGLIHGCSLLIKKDIFIEFGLFDETLKTVQDYSLWYDMFKKYPVCYQDEILIKSRRHSEQGHFTLSDYTQKEQEWLENKMILGLTIKEAAKLLDVQPKTLSAAADCENIELCYASFKVLKKIQKLNKINKFTFINIKSIFSALPQFKKIKFKDTIKRYKYLFKMLPLVFKLFFAKKDNTILMFEGNSYHGETFAGYINYFTELGYKVHFVAQKKLKSENPFVRIADKVDDKSLKVFYAKLNSYCIKAFFLLPFLSRYSKIFITSNLVYLYQDSSVIIMSKTVPMKLREKCIFIEHDTDNFIKADERALIKNGQIATLLKRKFENYSTRIINPCTFGTIEKKEKNASFTNFLVVGVIHKDYRGHYLFSEAVKELVDSGQTNFKITIVGLGDFENLEEKYRKFIDIKGRLSFEDMFREVEQADFLLFLFDNENKNHERFIHKNVTGSLQLALGFGIIPIVHKKFADVYGLSCDNSIIQEDKTLAFDMQKAIQLSLNEYKNKQENLKKLKEFYWQKSIEEVQDVMQK